MKYPSIVQQLAFQERCSLLNSSFERLLGRPLIEDPSDVLLDLATQLFDSPEVIVSHGIQEDPLFWFGNRTALEWFEMDWQTFTQLPSRKSAEMPERGERERLLKEVSENGFIENYSGIRVSSSGKRFRINNAIVWNLIDEAGNKQGQAAMFSMPPR